MVVILLHLATIYTGNPIAHIGFVVVRGVLDNKEMQPY
jgi:hypothetical protein